MNYIITPFVDPTITIWPIYTHFGRDSLPHQLLGIPLPKMTEPAWKSKGRHQSEHEKAKRRKRLEKARQKADKGGVKWQQHSPNGEKSVEI